MNSPRSIGKPTRTDIPEPARLEIEEIKFVVEEVETEDHPGVEHVRLGERNPRVGASAAELTGERHRLAAPEEVPRRVAELDETAFQGRDAAAEADLVAADLVDSQLDIELAGLLYGGEAVASVTLRSCPGATDGTHTRVFDDR